MTAICYVGIEISANFQKALLGIELTMLLVLSIWALVKVGNGTAPVGHLTPSPPGSIRSIISRPPGSWPGSPSCSSSIGVGIPPCRSTRRRRTPIGPRAGRPCCRRSSCWPPMPWSCWPPSPTPASAPTASDCRTGPTQGDVLNSLGASIFGASGFGNGHGPPAHLHGAHLGGRLHADHDPADGPHHPLHGRLQGHPVGLRPHPQAVPHPDRVHRGHGRRLDRALRRHELPHLGRSRDRRLGVGVGRHDRLSTTASLASPVPGITGPPCRERPQPLDPGRPARTGWPHPVRSA